MSILQSATGNRRSERVSMTFVLSAPVSKRVKHLDQTGREVVEDQSNDAFREAAAAAAEVQRLALRECSEVHSQPVVVPMHRPQLSKGSRSRQEAWKQRRTWQQRPHLEKSLTSLSLQRYSAHTRCSTIDSEGGAQLTYAQYNTEHAPAVLACTGQHYRLCNMAVPAVVSRQGHSC